MEEKIRMLHHVIYSDAVRKFFILAACGNK